MKILLLTLLSLLSLSAFASHIVGGIIHYECVGDNTYNITLYVYRDCNPGNSQFDNSPTIGIYENSVLIESLTMSFADAIVTTLPLETGDPCLSPPNNICVQEAIYTGTVTLPATSIGYTLAYQRCCRNTTILNVPAGGDNLGSTFFAEIPPQEEAICNSNPLFNELPPVLLCLNEPFVFDHAATDLDGDSLAYVFCNPKNGGSPGVEMNPPTAPPYIDVPWNASFDVNYPITSNPAFTLDPITGLFTGTPTLVGQYVVGICVEEWRDGILISTTNRDFQFNIVLCGQGIISFIEEEDPCQGTTFTFENGSAGGTEWFWDFGAEDLDADTSNLFEPEYTYPDTGTYTVMLIANPGEDCADTVFQTVYAYDPVFANIAFSGGECTVDGRIYSFEAVDDNGENVAFFWDFGMNGNPSTSNSQSLDVIFTEFGINPVILTVEEGLCIDVENLDLIVPPLPEAVIQEPLNLCIGLELDFLNLSTNASEYLWEFNDPNTTSIEENPSHTFPETGQYDILLIADPSAECADTTFQTVFTYEPVFANICFTGGECVGDERVYFFEAVGDFDENVDFFWDFGLNANPSTSFDQNPEVAFNTAGVNTFGLTIEYFVCNDIESLDLIVPPFPAADIEEQTTFCGGLDFDFVNLSADAQNYLWNFNDPNTVSTEENPSHSFPSFGDYNVILIADPNTSCADTSAITVTILPPDPIEFLFSSTIPGPCDTLSFVELNFTGSGADDITWNMGDGSVLTGSPVQYTYENLGNYTIEITAFQDLCDFEETQTLDIYFDTELLDLPLEMPNVFSPNNDGKNEKYAPYFALSKGIPAILPASRNVFDYLNIWDMKVFNRWGNLVFESSTNMGFWDGRFEGEYVSDGTYFVIFTYQRNCLDSGPISQSHEVTVLR